MHHPTDAQIGRILDALDELDLKKQTIVVFSSDNGLAVGSHGLMGKQNLYDHSVHVPMILAGPGIPGNEKRDQLCYRLNDGATPYPFTDRQGKEFWQTYGRGREKPGGG